MTNAACPHFTVNVTLPNGYAYRLEAGSKAAATRKVNETLKYNPGAKVTVLRGDALALVLALGLGATRT
ncbi:hypothetical protein [Mesorhizobium sp.]|uniref:hypothetical protein n=1 Tax=Mesorhizobium sp. TaxID=1871066 RepID=UPI000FE5FE31|nr:hypothetical protein [Mesorhizobium sp.]RWO22800.1 MAG: hypothetical protein EOS09_19200 [Mesorhizobium sp.]